MIKGLSQKEVKEKEKAGLVNGNFSVKTKSVGQIIFTNVFTLFNFVNIVLAICLVLVKSYKNIMFLSVVLWNVLIGVVQEVRSKRVIDKLSLLSAPHACVIRDGKEKNIEIKDIVLDDILKYKNGNQVCVDSIILEGECEVNESLLTGESDPVFKQPGDEVLSGSYLISGSVVAKAIHVGKENYVNSITSRAKYLKRPNSQIMNSIRTIIKIVSISLVPIAALLFWNQISEQKFNDAVVGTVAGILGMIPSGLVLLTSVVLAVSVVRLGKKDTLVQELYCIETLARVDTLCLDKTGTITEGTMTVDSIITLKGDNISADNVYQSLCAFTENLDDNNPTFNALCKYTEDGFDKDFKGRDFGKVLEAIRFSSDKKWSLIDFENEGTYILGALEFVMENPSDELTEEAKKYSSEGLRVLLFAHSEEHSYDKKLPEKIVPLALITLSDTIRPEAVETFQYFVNQGVNIKVISGDNPVTVSYVAGKAGIPDADKYIDATLLSTDEMIDDAVDEYTVFGRVTPTQKLQLIKSLKKKNHIVAMTGDGVNDVMALKEADCSIAMQSGSDAARNVSQIVLMNSNFANMPAVVAEGRRTINNLQRSASLYLTKTIYSTILAIMFVILPTVYPFVPIQMTFIGALSIGIPSFILALEPNVNRVKGRFIINVLRQSIPGAALVITNIMAAVIFDFMFNVSKEKFSALCLYGLAIAMLMHLIKCCIPFNKLRYIMCWVLAGLFVFGTTFFKGLLDLAKMNPLEGIFVLALLGANIALYPVYSLMTGKVMGSMPNIYRVHILYSEKTNIVLVEDDVDRKDYHDVTAQMMGSKILRADYVAFIKTPVNGGHIRVETDDKKQTLEITASAARYFAKRNNIRKDVVKINVETDFSDETIPVQMDVREHTAVFDKDILKNGEYMNENDNRKKVRYLKKLKLTF